MYSDNYVVMFLGFMSRYFPELGKRSPEEVIKAWDEFKMVVKNVNEEKSSEG